MTRNPIPSVSKSPSHCAGCELPLEQGQQVVVVAYAKVIGNTLKCRTLDIFHECCWDRHS